jgi:hypothetical protein
MTYRPPNDLATATSEELFERVKALIIHQQQLNLRATDEFVMITHELGMFLMEIRYRSKKYSFRNLELIIGEARNNLNRAVNVAKVDISVAITFRKSLGSIDHVAINTESIIIHVELTGTPIS